MVPLSSSSLSIVRVELMEELVVEVNVNMSVELQSLSVLVTPTTLCSPKPLEMMPVPHVGMTVQIMILPFLVHWYVATSPEHTGPGGPTSFVD